MEQDLREQEKKEHGAQRSKVRFYRKPWVRIVAVVLTFAMVLSIAANSAVYIRIRRGGEMDAATNYLVDNTDYINQDELKRLEEYLKAQQQAEQLEDYYRLAGTQIAKEDYGGALESIGKCLELYPGGDETLFVDLLLKRACLLVLLMRQDEALEALDKVLQRQPDHADAYLIKAQIYAEREALEPLKEALEAYLTYAPGEAAIRMVYAQVLFETQCFEEAAGQYKLLVDMEMDATQKSEIWYLLGLTYLQTDDHAACEAALEEARREDPDTELDGLDYYLGICRMSREAYAEAVESFDASIEAGSMLQHSRYSRGVCLLVIDEPDMEAALEDLLFASEYDEADADPNVKLQADDLLAQLQEVIEAPEGAQTQGTES